MLICAAACGGRDARAGGESALGSVQGREGLTVTPEPCRWFLNYFIWCPAVLRVAGAYTFSVTYQGAPLNITHNSDITVPMPGGLTHVNPAPAEAHLCTAEPALERAFEAGRLSGGAINLWDPLGNRGVLGIFYWPWETRWFEADGSPRPEGGFGGSGWPGVPDANPAFRRTGSPVPLPMFTYSATRLDCSSDCDATDGILQPFPDDNISGRVYFDYNFTRVGVYELHIAFKGARPRRPRSNPGGLAHTVGATRWCAVCRQQRAVRTRR